MKTIEERANTIAERYVDKLHQDIARSSAILCATEQKVIDEDAMHAIIEENVLRAVEKQAETTKREMIEKACEAVCVQCVLYDVCLYKEDKSKCPSRVLMVREMED